MADVLYETFFTRVSDSLKIKSQMELAKILGVNRSSITQAKKKGIVPSKWVLILFKHYALNPAWLEKGDGPIFLKQAEHCDIEQEYRFVPKVRARLCAGSGSFETDPGVKDGYFFQNKWIKQKGSPEDMVLMDIFGNSMEPELKNGDTVLVDCSQKDILAGLLYAVGIEDTIMVKRIEKHPGKLILRNDNRGYAPVIVEGEDINRVRIIGRVIWFCRNLS
jgi:phage repressor protein C with HTH and peptisase S24 domain